MKKYSPYIKKYIKEINKAGYTISDNGSQLSKQVGCYEILITDLTIRSSFTKIKTVLVWVKNKETRTIEVEKLYKHEILPLPFKRIDTFADKTILALKLNRGLRNQSHIQEITHDIDMNVVMADIKVREISLHDITV
ncbi:hypothetical protein D0T84_14180 [Dysgonomonas sp. 521]|uniref:hypothetical protein n=1 Tax=Dysgonomonas sp. 521 TaxID=2302932 RepID=UPI0013CF62F0|nr:hypothetical protein [Dysgonomonas sp. 521]NDV96051.1 hypothetical protein [Dysgonomonas sp. 521]